MHKFAIQISGTITAPIVGTFQKQTLIIKMTSMISGLVKEIHRKYYASTPAATAVLRLIEQLNGGAPVLHDHIAFRTFGENGFDNQSLARIFMDLNYREQGALVFPKKKVNALWYSPPHCDPPLPRLFSSELRVPDLSPAAQKIVRSYTESAGRKGWKWVAVSAVTGRLPWETPTLEDYETLLAENDFAAWVLVNGYALSHTTISVHRSGLSGGLVALNQKLKDAGFKLNTSGGEIKVSPDGGLLQSSTISEDVPFIFACGEERSVSGAYIEFAERKALPEFEHLAESELEEHQRRDGFEQRQADLIFDSTNTKKQAGVARVVFDDSEDSKISV